jgi:two-component system sensor histidine kinase KdpD
MLVTAASHDLRTPLASIKASSSILSDASLDLDSTVAHDLARLIDDQADRLADLVQNLLDMGRIQAGVLQPRVVSTTVRELVDTVVSDSASVLDQYSVEVELADELPAVTVDPMLIDRVLANLLANAARYAPKHSSIRIVARSVAPDGVEVSVVDRGPGVSRERQADIFGLNARRNEDSGAGLGLIIAKTFVEAHGQRIWVDDAPGGGARFSFTLPVGPTSPEHVVPAAERSSSVGADSHH